MKTAFLALLLFGVSALAEEPISFERFQPGDAMLVKFTSRGCFHYRSYEFEFRRASKTTAKVARIEHRWDEATEKDIEGARVPLGTVTVSKAELDGLNRLMAFYRLKHPGWCTTIDHIAVTHKRGNGRVTTESLTDESCSTRDVKNLTRFTAIAEKLEPRKE